MIDRRRPKREMTAANAERLVLEANTTVTLPRKRTGGVECRLRVYALPEYVLACACLRTNMRVGCADVSAVRCNSRALASGLRRGPFGTVFICELRFPVSRA
ncbi:hypothetical protein MRX96_054240 [Rhipicephalus microplus]